MIAITPSIGILGFIIWVIVMYLLISYAVSSGVSDLKYDLKVVTRIELYRLRKSGVSMDEIKTIYEAKDSKYWHHLEQLLVDDNKVQTPNQ